MIKILLLLSLVFSSVGFCESDFHLLETQGNFTYAGENGGDCTGDVCRGGYCAGSGVCELQAAQINLNFPNLLPATVGWYKDTFVAIYKSFTITGGTVKLPARDANQVYGRQLFLFVNGDFTIETGTLDLSAEGALGAKISGALDCNHVGIQGGSSTYMAARPAAATTAVGDNGPDLIDFANAFALNYNLLLVGRYWTPGTGGGTHSTASGTAAVVIPRLSIPTLNSGGGNGGGCEAGCSGTSANGGNGGGGLWMEVKGATNLTSGIIDLDGQNGSNGSAGGAGGGFVLVFYGDLNQAGTDIQTSGGLMQGVSPTNCHDGGNGAVGPQYFVKGF